MHFIILRMLRLLLRYKGIRMPKKKLFSVTKKDLVIEYFSGTGAGGMHRNKCQNSCRVKHPPSRAIGVCQEHRSKVQNTKIAFRRMVDSKEFQNWIRIEASRITGETAQIEKKIDKELQNNVKEEVQVDGKWVKKEVE